MAYNHDVGCKWQMVRHSILLRRRAIVSVARAVPVLFLFFSLSPLRLKCTQPLDGPIEITLQR